jgi:hypothetical protein
MHTSSGPSANVPAPEYDWVEDRKESFVLDAGARAIYGPAQGSDAGNPLKAHFLRYDIRSTAPVDTGAMDATWFKNASDSDNNFRYFFGSAVTLCYTAKTLQSEHACRLTGATPAGYILVRDSRSASGLSAVTALAGAAVGVKEPLRNAVRENRVTLTFYQWRCVRFCPDIHRP